jgi:hypothetical protein
MLPKEDAMARTGWAPFRWHNLILVALAGLAGCAAFLPHVDADDKPIPGHAYVYGRFSKVAHGGAFGTGGSKNVLLTLKCDNGKQILFGFSEDDPLKLLDVAPSTCVMDELVFTDALAMPIRHIPLTSKRLDFAAGKAYYIGDYHLEISNDWNPIATRVTWRREASDNYEATTRDLGNAYPHFSSFPTENRFKK